MQVHPADRLSFRQFIWILYFCLVAGTGLYWIVPYYIPLERGALASSLLKPAFLVLGALSTAAALYVRFSLIAALLEFKGPPAPPDFYSRLRTYYIVCYTLCESVGLYGLVWFLMGGTRLDFGLLYFSALGLFAICYPRLPETLGPRM